MRPIFAQPFFCKSWMIALAIALVFGMLEYGLKLKIEIAHPYASHSWLDLTLVLCSYLFMFCLQPIQKAVQRKLSQHAERNKPI